MSGVGSPDGADLDAALFLRAVNEHPTLHPAFPATLLEVPPPHDGSEPRARDEERGMRGGGRTSPAHPTTLRPLRPFTLTLRARPTLPDARPSAPDPSTVPSR